MVLWFLTVIMKPGYMGEFEIVDGHGAGKVVVNLTGRLKRCEVISCRFDVPLKNLVKWQNNPLPVQAGRLHCTDPSWHHGPQRSQMKVHRRDKPRILFLGMQYIHTSRMPQWEKTSYQQEYELGVCSVSAALGMPRYSDVIPVL